LRVRNVIAEQPSNKQIVAEEMWLLGYEGEVNQKNFLVKEEALNILMSVKASQNMEELEKALEKLVHRYNNERQHIPLNNLTPADVNFWTWRGHFKR